MIEQHLIILMVAVPLIAAPICVLLHHPRVVWLFSTIVAAVTFAITVALAVKVFNEGPISYALGDWKPPIGIEYLADPLSVFMCLIVAGGGLGVMLYARQSVEHEVENKRIYLFYTMYLLCLCGLLGIPITGDAFNLFVFLEISSLSSYVLISLGEDRRALTAAFQYLIMGTIGATFILLGVGLLYMITGTLNMADLAQRLAGLESQRTMLVAFAFITVGASLKLALFPLHLWLPNAYAYAPSMVTAFLAATATKVSVYILVRFFFTIFGLKFSFEALDVGWILLPLSLVAIYVASTVAVFQNNVKRLLAYSSVAQVGYMVLGISFASVTGLTAGIVHLWNHALIKGGMFLALGCIFYRIGSVKIDDMAGLGRQMPVTMAAFVIGGLGLIGVPMTAGFISKWYLVLAAIEKDWWIVAVLMLLSSLIAIAYVWRVVEAAYFRPFEGNASEATEAPIEMLIPTWILVGGSLYFGLDTSASIGLAQQAAEMLLGVVK